MFCTVCQKEVQCLWNIELVKSSETISTYIIHWHRGGWNEYFISSCLLQLLQACLQFLDIAQNIECVKVGW